MYFAEDVNALSAATKVLNPTSTEEVSLELNWSSYSFIELLAFVNLQVVHLFEIKNDALEFFEHGYTLPHLDQEYILKICTA